MRKVKTSFNSAPGSFYPVPGFTGFLVIVKTFSSELQGLANGLFSFFRFDNQVFTLLLMNFLARVFTEGKWTHDYLIKAGSAKALGIPVSTEMAESLVKLMSMYPQPVKKTLPL